MGEISHMIINKGFNLGVVDFNITKDYIYVDYLTPKPSADRNIQKYDWNNKNTDNIINSQDLISVRLRKDYIDHLFEEDKKKLKDIKYLDKEVLPELFEDGDETQSISPITINPKKRLTLFETDREGKEQKILRSSLNVGVKVFNYYKNEYLNYKELPDSNENYEGLMRQMFFSEIREEVEKNYFVEHGRAFVKQNINDENKIHVQVKKYNSQKTSREQTLDYLDEIDTNITNPDIKSTTKKVRFFHDFSFKEGYANLMNEGTEGSDSDKMIYKIISGSVFTGTGIYGMVRYNFSNSLYKGDEKDGRMLDNIRFKKNAFYQIYGTMKDSGEKNGPIKLKNETNLVYVLTPYIKYSHGLIFTQEGKIKKSNYYGILYWFYLKQIEGKFANKNEWYEFYKSIVLQGLYNINADPKKFNLNTNFKIQFEIFIASLEGNKKIGKLDKDTVKKLEEFKNYEYDKELKLEKNFPQLRLHTLKTKDMVIKFLLK